MIDINKKYRTRSGRSVIIYSTSGKDWAPVHGAVEGQLLSWKANGTYYETEGSDLDLIEINPHDEYANFRIDEKVYAWNDGQFISQHAHFAGVSCNGKPLVFSEGRTSWTNGNCLKIEFDYCKSENSEFIKHD